MRALLEHSVQSYGLLTLKFRPVDPTLFRAHLPITYLKANIVGRSVEWITGRFDGPSFRARLQDEIRALYRLSMTLGSASTWLALSL